MKKIKIFTDSPSDITKEMAEKFNITVLPLTVSFGDESYKEFYEITPKEFYEKMKQTKIVPKTSQIPPSVFEEAFREALKFYDTIIYISLSSTLSGTYQSAITAKNAILEDTNADIEIIDSKTVTIAYGLVVLKAAELALNGGTKEEILKLINNMLSNCKIYFVLDTLEYLKKGGRISATKLMLGTLLDIKPVLDIKDGYLVQTDKIRGSKSVIPRLVEIIKSSSLNLKNYTIVFAHSDNYDKMKQLKDALLTELTPPKEVLEADIGCVIGSHGGPGILGVFIWNEI